MLSSHPEIKAEEVEFSKEVKSKSAFESDYVGFDSHPDIEVEGQKFIKPEKVELSEEVYEQCKDEVAKHCTQEDV